MHDKAKKIQLWFAVSGITALVLIIVAIIYALNFLSANIISSLSTGEGVGQEVKFNIEGYQKLNIR